MERGKFVRLISSQDDDVNHRRETWETQESSDTASGMAKIMAVCLLFCYFYSLKMQGKLSVLSVFPQGCMIVLNQSGKKKAHTAPTDGNSLRRGCCFRVESGLFIFFKNNSLCVSPCHFGSLTTWVQGDFLKFCLNSIAKMLAFLPDEQCRVTVGNMEEILTFHQQVTFIK